MALSKNRGENLCFFLNTLLFFPLFLIMDNLQEPLENSDTSLTSGNRRKSFKKAPSWIWEFFDLEIRDNCKWAICKLDKMGTDIPCKKEYKTGGSTKNCIDHLLNKHNLSKDGQKKKVNLF
jgi:hypothetical protein